MHYVDFKIYFVASLFFVVNFFDHYFTSPQEENNPDEKGVKNDVVSAFSDVNKSDVYPVCGQWAFNAHISMIQMLSKLSMLLV